MGILTQDMMRIVREQRLGYVATVCADGTPNLSPKGTTTVWDDDHLVFADICSPGTMANLERNPTIEVNVVDPIARRGYRFKGRATIFAEGPQFAAGLDFYRRVHALDEAIVARIRTIVLITVERAVPLISPIYDLGVTQSEVEARYRAYYGGLRTGRREASQRLLDRARLAAI
jgi:uncharacterized protein